MLVLLSVVLPGDVALPGVGAHVFVVGQVMWFYQMQVPMFSWFCQVMSFYQVTQLVFGFVVSPDGDAGIYIRMASPDADVGVYVLVILPGDAEGVFVLVALAGDGTDVFVLVNLLNQVMLQVSLFLWLYFTK